MNFPKKLRTSQPFLHSSSEKARRMVILAKSKNATQCVAFLSGRVTAVLCNSKHNASLFLGTILPDLQHKQYLIFCPVGSCNPAGEMSQKK